MASEYVHDKDCIYHVGYGLCNCGTFLRGDTEEKLHQEYQEWWRSREPEDPAFTFSGWLRQFKNVDTFRQSK
jgi:hypothetical protein